MHGNFQGQDGKCCLLVSRKFAKHVPNFSSLYTTLATSRQVLPFSVLSSNSTIRVKGRIRIESMHDLILCVVVYGSQVLYYKSIFRIWIYLILVIVFFCVFY